MLNVCILNYYHIRLCMYLCQKMCFLAWLSNNPEHGKGSANLTEIPRVRVRQTDKNTGKLWQIGSADLFGNNLKPVSAQAERCAGIHVVGLIRRYHDQSGHVSFQIEPRTYGPRFGFQNVVYFVRFKKW